MWLDLQRADTGTEIPTIDYGLTLKRKLHCELHDSGIQRARNLAEGRRAIVKLDSRGACLQAGRRDARTHAIGHVKGFGAKLHFSYLTDAKLPGKRRVKPPRRGTWSVHAAHGAERAQRGEGEGGPINPAVRRRTGVRTQRVLEDLDRPLDGGGRRGQRLVGGQAGRKPVRRCGPENLRE